MINSFASSYYLIFYLGPSTIYYSLRSFVDTYSNTSPVCLEDEPITKIQVSIACLFFAAVVFVCALQITLRSLYLERYKKQIEAGKKGLPISDNSSHA